MKGQLQKLELFYPHCLGLWDVARDGHEGFGHEDPCGPDAACLHRWQPDLGTQETVRLLLGLGGLF